jgi:hypothetical protein
MHPSGKDFDLDNPDPDAVDIRDIAHGLATMNRFGGRARDPISVAEHCVCCVRRGRDEGLHHAKVLRALLLHDAAEAYVGELSRDIKHREDMAAYRWLEHRVLDAVWLHVVIAGHDIAPAYSPAVRRIDAAVGDAEAAWLLSEKPIVSPDGREVPWVWVTAREAFLLEASRLGLVGNGSVAERCRQAFDP